MLIISVKMILPKLSLIASGKRFKDITLYGKEFRESLKLRSSLKFAQLFKRLLEILNSQENVIKIYTN